VGGEGNETQSHASNRKFLGGLNHLGIARGSPKRGKKALRGGDGGNGKHQKKEGKSKTDIRGKAAQKTHYLGLADRTGWRKEKSNIPGTANWRKGETVIEIT